MGNRLVANIDNHLDSKHVDPCPSKKKTNYFAQKKHGYKIE